MTPPNSIDREEKLPPIKLYATEGVIVLILAILVFGLWRLQVLGVDNYRTLAEANRVRKVPVLAPRGKIFDREGRLIVDNYSSTSCFILRDQIKDSAAELPMIAAGLHLPLEQIQGTLRRYAAAPKYQPIPLKQDITPDEEAFVEAHRNELPELETLEEQRRLYPRDGFAAHLIGYVGEVSEQMLEKDSRYDFYQPGDVVGRSGVESTYDSILRGVDGSRDVIVNSHGKEVGQLGQEIATPGKDLHLTIDLDVQMAAEKALEGKNGAVVALDPHTGEVLAMVSRPTFDPNQFSVRVSHSYWNSILENPDNPLLNKAIQAQLAPGSTFKIIMSVAGLEENIAQELHVNCQGGATFYGQFHACDSHHGSVDIHNAIPYSCDTYYYNLADRLGIDRIAKYAVAFGLSQKTGIDLPNEASGTMPSTAWKLKTQHERWYPSEAISVGIGQGAVTASPIQLARAIGGIASGGVLYRPHVVMPGQIDPKQQAAIYEDFPGAANATIPMHPETWQIVTEGMSAVTSASGTASIAHLEGIDFAGKTGTAQVMSHAGLAKAAKGRNTEPNAWFVGIAPRRNPDIVVAVLFEHGVWGKYSAKIAAQVIDAFVTKQRSKAGNIKLAEATPASKPVAATPPNPSQ